MEVLAKSQANLRRHRTLLQLSTRAELREVASVDERGNADSLLRTHSQNIARFSQRH